MIINKTDVNLLGIIVNQLHKTKQLYQQNDYGEVNYVYVNIILKLIKYLNITHILNFKLNI